MAGRVPITRLAAADMSGGVRPLPAGQQDASLEKQLAPRLRVAMDGKFAHSVVQRRLGD